MKVGTVCILARECPPSDYLNPVAILDSEQNPANFNAAMTKTVKTGHCFGANFVQYPAGVVNHERIAAGRPGRKIIWARLTCRSHSLPPMHARFQTEEWM